MIDPDDNQAPEEFPESGANYVDGQLAIMRQQVDMLRGQLAQAMALVSDLAVSGQMDPDTDDAYPEEILTQVPDTTRIISFGCTASGTTVTVKQGKVYFKGVSQTIASWPSNGEVSCSATTHAYIEIDLANATATWKTAASDPGNGDDDTEIWRIFVATVSSGAITELLECQHGDIHIPGNA
jgi:hypothetical protein